MSEQARLLGLNRTGLYYRPAPTPERDLLVKQCIDRIYTAHPFYGYRRIKLALKREHSLEVNHKAVLRHMREMGIQAVYPRQDTSRPQPGNPVYPYLLKGLDIVRPDQVWSIDITYVPIKSDWLYLVAILDWFSRFIVSWSVSDTLEMDFVLDACGRAVESAVPEIMNSDQGSHFTSPRYTKIFLDSGSRISMDHRGRAYDNIFIERLWRTLKYEDIYVREYGSPREARIGIRDYIDFYNHERPHSGIGNVTPAEKYAKT